MKIINLSLSEEQFKSIMVLIRNREAEYMETYRNTCDSHIASHCWEEAEALKGLEIALNLQRHWNEQAEKEA